MPHTSDHRMMQCTGWIAQCRMTRRAQTGSSVQNDASRAVEFGDQPQCPQNDTFQLRLKTERLLSLNADNKVACVW